MIAGGTGLLGSDERAQNAWALVDSRSKRAMSTTRLLLAPFGWDL
jgi:hypothetical protein